MFDSHQFISSNMRSLNETKLLLFFLLIKIICVTCPPTDEDLENCENELYMEFKNVEPLEDFIHGFLNVAYFNVNYNEVTETNENIFVGNTELKILARTYYYDMYNTAIEMGIPELLTPQEFCSGYYDDDVEMCLSSIAAVGCRANLSGSDCFEKMYFRWKKKDETSYSMPGTQYLSDDQLLDAMYKGSIQFRNSVGDDLSEDLSDENLLREFYRIYFSNSYEDNYEGIDEISNRRNANHDDIFGRNAYMNYLKTHRNDRNRLSRPMFDKMNLKEARMRVYGIPNASYSDICAEFQRRKNSPKFYDNLYAEDICGRFRSSTWDTDNFKSRAFFCETHLSEEE